MTEGDPVFLHGTCTFIDAGGTHIGKSAGLDDTTRIKPLDSAPMFIDELRFQTNSSTMLHGILHVRLSAGTNPITKGFVPVWMLGRQTNGNELDLGGSCSVHTWRLPRPLLVMPDTPLIVTFGVVNPSAAFSLPTTMVNHLGVVGRKLPKAYRRPRSIAVPWVAHYATTYRSTGGATDKYSDSSTKADLCNPFDVPLNVQALNGRVLFNDSGSPNEPGSAGGLRGDISSIYTLVRMVGSSGKIIVRDNTPFSHVFDQQERRWTVNAVLPPKGFYLASVTRDLSSLPASKNNLAHIAIVGYREARI